MQLPLVVEIMFRKVMQKMVLLAMAVAFGGAVGYPTMAGLKPDVFVLYRI